MLRQRILLPLLLLLLLLGDRAIGAEDFWDRVQIHGFVSQSAVHTSANRFFGDSPNTSLAFTEVGLNASARLTPQVLVAAQLLSRRAGDMYDGTPAVDFALADINLLSAPHGRLGLRAGRLKNPLGLYNETRDIAFTRPGIFLPQTVYFDRIRNLLLSSDGVHLYGDLDRDFGSLSFQIGTGHAIVDDNVQAALLFGTTDGRLRPSSRSWLAGLWYTSEDQRLRLGLSGATLALKHDHRQGASGRIDLFYGIASAQYNTERWAVSAEYMHQPIKWRDFGSAVPISSATGESYYLEGVYRIRPQVAAMLRYEEGFVDRADRDGRRLRAKTFGMLPRGSAFSNIATAGLRWELGRHWLLRAEYQHHQGHSILSGIENPDSSLLRDRWHLFALQAAFRF